MRQKMRYYTDRKFYVQKTSQVLQKSPPEITDYEKIASFFLSDWNLR